MNNKQKILVTLLLLLGAGGAAFYFVNKVKAQAKPTPTPTPNTTDNPTVAPQFPIESFDVNSLIRNKQPNDTDVTMIPTTNRQKNDPFGKNPIQLTYKDQWGNKFVKESADISPYNLGIFEYYEFYLVNDKYVYDANGYYSYTLPLLNNSENNYKFINDYIVTGGEGFHGEYGNPTYTPKNYPITYPIFKKGEVVSGYISTTYQGQKGLWVYENTASGQYIFIIPLSFLEKTSIPQQSAWVDLLNGLTTWTWTTDNVNI